MSFSAYSELGIWTRKDLTVIALADCAIRGGLSIGMIATKNFSLKSGHDMDISCNDNMYIIGNKIDKIHLDIIKEWVNAAERNSENICEYCGEPGKLFVTVGLWEVLCDNHKRTNALTVEEYRIEQAILQKARRKCNVCGVTNVDMYFDGNQVAGYCEYHKKDFITADLYYDQTLANYNKQNRI